MNRFAKVGHPHRGPTWFVLLWRCGAGREYAPRRFDRYPLVDWLVVILTVIATVVWIIIVGGLPGPQAT